MKTIKRIVGAFLVLLTATVLYIIIVKHAFPEVFPMLPDVPTISPIILLALCLIFFGVLSVFAIDDLEGVAVGIVVVALALFCIIAVSTLSYEKLNYTPRKYEAFRICESYGYQDVMGSKYEGWYCYSFDRHNARGPVAIRDLEKRKE